MLYFHEQIHLKGDRIISSMKVTISKYEVPILAARNKKSVTNIIDVTISIQDVLSNSFRRFQVGSSFSGDLENQD